MNRLSESFQRNPAAWMLGALLLLSVFFHYGTGEKLERVCSYAQSMFQTVASELPRTNPDAYLLQRLCDQQLAEPHDTGD